VVALWTFGIAWISARKGWRAPAAIVALSLALSGALLSQSFWGRGNNAGGAVAELVGAITCLSIAFMAVSAVPIALMLRLRNIWFGRLLVGLSVVPWLLPFAPFGLSWVKHLFGT
jgi:hypothetical protein